MSSVLDRPLISFGREICGDLNAGMRREWLVTNGLGGYASGTLSGPNSRRYHGWLVAALNPPVGRTVLVSGAVEWAMYDGRRYALSSHEFADGTIHPDGYRHLQSFALEGTLPVWTFALADALVERRIWMRYGANTAYVMYRVVAGSRTVHLEITPLVTYRDFHSLTSGRDWHPSAEALPDGVIVRAHDQAVPFALRADAARFVPADDWYWNFLHREERARGLDDRSDLYTPGTFFATMRPGGRLSLCLTAEDQPVMAWDRALDAERVRQVLLLRRAGAERANRVVQQLILAADQFIVERRGSEEFEADPDAVPAGKAIIAGYHWFSEWGRDTMIALPGLCLATGRVEEARGVLRGFAPYLRDGLLPNNHPETASVEFEYNAVDAPLWYVLAVHAYRDATGDASLPGELLPALLRIVESYTRGTRFGIGADSADGLLQAGEPGVQLTWMDAKVGPWVVTPRIGKPVEINALWYNTLRSLSSLLAAGPHATDAAAARAYAAQADRVRISFRERFIRPEVPWLADVVDGPDGDDLTLRPNQILAVSLPYPLLEATEAAGVVDAVGRKLLTTYGLRSLNPEDPNYHGDYAGDPLRRDGAYHQGPVWTWLMGPYAEAYFKVHRGRRAALALLRPFEHHLRDAGLGTVSEIVEGEPPHGPRGCIAQAWSVAEVLRVWRTLADHND